MLEYRTQACLGGPYCLVLHRLQFLANTRLIPFIDLLPYLQECFNASFQSPEIDFTDRHVRPRKSSKQATYGRYNGSKSQLISC